MNHAQLTALGRALRLLGEHGDALNADTPDARLHEVKADLKRALDLLDETVTTAAPTTRCAEHPNGPVDESAPDRCLLCETRRRTARRTEVNDAYGHGRTPAPDELPDRTMSRYGVRGDRPQPQQRWLPEVWNGQTWLLCGTPRRDRQEAERYLAAERRAPRPGMAYRLVHEFTDYEVLRIWGTPVKVDIEPMGNL
ncbi:hypothetical protein CW362_20720 [Streptomyces populi]|uniref:Uncharacterized protein n=2 Tax=Streptomyces TaxID=1883 RepID=A0A2I0SME0_9ACTN|nr:MULTISPECIES: hypothetical protein [Streptomyces]KAB1988523.1 hypothetical protein F8144_12925 [Streptomyces triticiradicis]PKT71095.1 hypothetical protein CW362_20720 [Streptomyces populi]